MSTSKILYNVTIKIDKDISQEWLLWMRTVHIPEVMGTNLFLSYRITKIIEDEDEYGIGYAIQYVSPSYEHMLTYNKNHAPALQKKHNDKYYGKYGAFRTVMEIIGEG